MKNKTMCFLAALMSSTNVFAAPVSFDIAGPFEMTIPGDFQIVGTKFIDQNNSMKGIQVNAFIVQGHNGIDDVIGFETDSVVSGQTISLGRTISPDIQGFASGGFIDNGRLYAYGTRGDDVFIWTPSFNSGEVKTVNISQAKGNGCSLVTLPSGLVAADHVIKDQDENAFGNQLCI